MSPEELKARKKEAMSKPHTLVVTTKKTNKVRRVMETTCGKAQLVYWAMMNTTKSQKSVIYETESKQITDIITGNDNFPKVEKDIYEQELFVEVED